MKPDYAGLIERLEAASGPDRKLDIALYEALVGYQQYESAHRFSDGEPGIRHYPTFDAPTYRRLPCLTASIDAALALVEKVLPGWSWSIHAGPKGSLVYLCRDWNDDYAPTFRSRETKPKRQTIFEKQEPDSKTPPLAILIAMLRALQSQEPRDA